MNHRIQITAGRHKGKTGRVVGLYAATPHSDVRLAEGRVIKVADRWLAASARPHGARR
jgi:hypothetical protein